jgi:hypothetical protein
MIGIFTTGIRAFGLSSVRGPNLVPRPAARIMAFIASLHIQNIIVAFIVN